MQFRPFCLVLFFVAKNHYLPLPSNKFKHLKVNDCILLSTLLSPNHTILIPSAFPHSIHSLAIWLFWLNIRKNDLTTVLSHWGNMTQTITYHPFCNRNSNMSPIFFLRHQSCKGHWNNRWGIRWSIGLLPILILWYSDSYPLLYFFSIFQEKLWGRFTRHRVI